MKRTKRNKEKIYMVTLKHDKGEMFTDILTDKELATLIVTDAYITIIRKVEL